MLTVLAKLLSILNSDANPSQISLAITLAMLAGVNSYFSLLGLIAICLLFVLRANISAFLALSAVFALLSFALAPVLSSVGDGILTSQSMQPLFTSLYNQEWFQLFALNNTLVMGSAIVSLVLAVPVFFLSNIMVEKYRAAMMEFVNKFKIVQTLKASKFYNIYQSVKG